MLCVDNGLNHSRNIDNIVSKWRVKTKTRINFSITIPNLLVFLRWSMPSDAVRCTCPYHTEFYYIISQRYKITLGFLPQQTHPKRTHKMNKTTELCVANRHPINTTKRYNRKTTKLCQQINISNDWMQRSFPTLSNYQITVNARRLCAHWMNSISEDFQVTCGSNLWNHQ